MQILDLLLVTALLPVISLIFVIFMDICATHAKRRRKVALERYQPGLFSSVYGVPATEDLVIGGRHAQF